MLRLLITVQHLAKKLGTALEELLMFSFETYQSRNSQVPPSIPRSSQKKVRIILLGLILGFGWYRRGYFRSLGRRAYTRCFGDCSSVSSLPRSAAPWCRVFPTSIDLASGQIYARPVCQDYLLRPTPCFRRSS